MFDSITALEAERFEGFVSIGVLHAEMGDFFTVQQAPAALATPGPSVTGAG